MSTDRIYEAYLDGYTRSFVGGRAKNPGILSWTLSYLDSDRLRRRAARALGIEDGTQERSLKTRAELFGRVAALLGEDDMS